MRLARARRVAAAAAAGALLVLGVGFALRLGGLEAAANVVQVLSGVPLLAALWTWAAHRSEERSVPRWLELGELLQMIAEADGMTTAQLCHKLSDWSETQVTAYLAGTRRPGRAFLDAFMASVAGDDEWHREVLFRRIHPVWDASAADPRSVAESREWAGVVREVVRAREVLSEVYGSVTRHGQLQEDLAEMLARLTEAVRQLSAERRNLREQLETREGEARTAMQAEIGRLADRLADAEERLRAATRLQQETSVRLADSERQRREAEELRLLAQERMKEAATRLADLDSRPALPPPMVPALPRHAEWTTSLMGDDDQRVAATILDEVDLTLHAEASALHRLHDALVTGDGRTTPPVGGEPRAPAAVPPHPRTGMSRRRLLIVAGAVTAAGAGAAVPLLVPRAPEIGTRFAPPLNGHLGAVETVTVGMVNGKLIAVSGSADTTIRRWDMKAGEAAGGVVGGGAGVVTCVAIAKGRQVIVSGSSDAVVRLWDATSGRAMGDDLIGFSGPVNDVVVAEVGARAMVVAGGSDATIRIWDLATHKLVGGPITAHAGGVTAVAATRLNGRSVVVSGGRDDAVRLWDAATGEPVSAALKGHSGDITSVTAGTVDGKPVAVSGSVDKTIWLWDLSTTRTRGKPLKGHLGGVNAVALAEVQDQAVIVSGGQDGLRVWDPVGARQLAAPAMARAREVLTVAIGELAGRSVAVFGGTDPQVGVWYLENT